MGKRLLKELSNASWAQGAVGAIMAAYIRLIRATSSIEYVNVDIPTQFDEKKEAAVVACWHSQISLCVYCTPTIKNSKALVSENKDGEIIARIIKRFGYGAIRGSTANPKKNKAKGGTRALKEMLRALSSGEIVLITPDGPRGPRMIVSPGTATLARLSGAPIIPFGFSARRAVELNSWDRFLVPVPFSKYVFVWGEPVTLAKDADKDDELAFLNLIQERMLAATEKADEMAGRKSSQIDDASIRKEVKSNDSFDGVENKADGPKSLEGISKLGVNGTQ